MESQKGQQSERHSFRRIGSLLPPASNSPSTSATPSSRSTALPTASVPTAPTKGPPAKTGTPAGEHGVSKTLSSMATQELANLSTGALMKALEASLPPQLALQPVWRDGETEWEMPMAYTVEGLWETKGIAMGLIYGTMTPLPVKEIAKELTTLNALTKRRKDDQGDTELLVAAYVEKLAPYPGEAVVHVLRKWPETEKGKWWPSWSELYDMLEYRVGERRLMLEALG